MSAYAEKDPTEIIPALGVSRQAYAMASVRSLAAQFVAEHGPRNVSEAASDAAVRLMCELYDPDVVAAETVTVHRGHLAVMLGAYLVAAETHEQAKPMAKPKGGVS